MRYERGVQFKAWMNAMSDIIECLGKIGMSVGSLIELVLFYHGCRRGDRGFSEVS